MARISSFVVLSLGLCFATPARAEVPAAIPAAIPPATTEQVQQTVDRAIGYLQTESAAWLNTRKCAACHHVPMPLWALSEAERQGYAIDKKFVADTTESLLGSRDKLMASKIFPNPADPPDPRPQGRGLNMGLPFLAVAARSLPSLEEGQKQSLKLIAEEIVKKQQPDGSWEFFATLRRPPINESQTTDAAWIIMALEGETGPDAPESQRAALSKAIAWLDAAKPSDIHQDKVLKVLLGARSGKPRETMQTTIDELLALQRADGGWSQTVPELKSDAFATGQTLYVLSLAGYHGRTTRNQARDRLPGRHAKAGRQLADDFSIDPRWLARERETIDADHLRRQFLGHARPGETCAEKSFWFILDCTRPTRLSSSSGFCTSRAGLREKLRRVASALRVKLPATAGPRTQPRCPTVSVTGLSSLPFSLELSSKPPSKTGIFKRTATDGVGIVLQGIGSVLPDGKRGRQQGSAHFHPCAEPCARSRWRERTP